MNDRLSSGSPRLDELVGGGLPAHAINLVTGPPGSGKTILSQQYLFHNATSERPGVYLSTVSEPFDKVLRYGEALSFFDAEAIGTSVFYDDLGSALITGGLARVLDRVDGIAKELQPGIIVIDSFKALRAFADDEAEFRRFLHDLAGRLTVLATSSFWVGEYEQSFATHAAEFAVADAIISMDTKRTAERELRVLQILKLRGSGSRSGEHAYRIGADGILVYPRLADPLDASKYSIVTQRQSTGIPALDAALGDGLWPGASTIVAGPSGVGKTLMSLHFVLNATDEDRAVFATFQENRTQLDRIAHGFGWRLDQAAVELLIRSPVDLYIDEWVYELLDLIDRVGARRVVIDSLADLISAAPDSTRFRELMYSLMQRCSRLGISSMFTLEVPDLFGVSHISDEGISHLSDNVVLLQYVRADGQLKRTLSILKSRASAHTPEVREYVIGDDGMILADAVSHSFQ